MIITGTLPATLTKMEYATNVKNLILANFPDITLISDTGAETTRLIKFRVPCTNHIWTVYTNNSYVGVAFRNNADTSDLRTNSFGSGTIGVNYTLLINTDSGAFLTSVYLGEIGFVYSKITGDDGLFCFNSYEYVYNSDVALEPMYSNLINVFIRRLTSDLKEVFLPAFCADRTNLYVQKVALSDILSFTNKTSYAINTKLSINGSIYYVIRPNLVMKG